MFNQAAQKVSISTRAKASANAPAMNAGFAEPLCWLGAASPGGLALPDAHPTASQLYAPRGVWLQDDLLIAVDSGNHRVLIWHELPTRDGQAADVVLGQPDFHTEGPQAGGRGAENGMHLPTGVAVVDGRLIVADAWHHRLLVWNEIPQSSFTPPDYALGQRNLAEIKENRGASVSAGSFYWPYGFAFIAGRFYVADTGNRRVLGWQGLPEPDQPADLVLGQDAPALNLENRGLGISASSFRWPHSIAGNAETLYVADAGNHRVLGWTPHPLTDAPAALVLGQPDFATAQELPYRPQGARSLRFPYAIALEGDLLAVADTANNRVLCWKSALAFGAYQAADAVIGQPDFDSNGENRWQFVGRDTLCWPYGIALHKGLLAVADSGNNRVTLWKLHL